MSEVKEEELHLNDATFLKSGALSQTFSAGDVLNNSASDLFKDFDNDRFKEVKQGDSGDGASFADFSSAFGQTESKVASSPSGQIHSPSVSSYSSTSTSHTKKPAPPPTDRYAALADLDNQLHQQAAPEMPVVIPSAITTSTAASTFWPTPAAAVFTPVPANPFSNSPWPPQAPNPFQGVVPGSQPSASYVAKPSLPNGNSFWSQQPWLAAPFQNDQTDAFQSKAPVVDACNPWSQSFGAPAANPFMPQRPPPEESVSTESASVATGVTSSDCTELEAKSSTVPEVKYIKEKPFESRDDTSESLTSVNVEELDISATESTLVSGEDNERMVSEISYAYAEARRASYKNPDRAVEYLLTVPANTTLSLEDQKKDSSKRKYSKTKTVYKKAKLYPEITEHCLRPIVIDASNVAISHGQESHTFSAKGLKICIEYFTRRGHNEIVAFLPMYRRKKNCGHRFRTTGYEILKDLENRGFIKFTPSREVNGKTICSYDDRFILELASITGGIVVSNDNFNDLINDKESFRETIEERLLMFTFIGDIFMPPEDPLGKDGPDLNSFLCF